MRGCCRTERCEGGGGECGGEGGDGTGESS